MQATSQKQPWDDKIASLYYKQVSDHRKPMLGSFVLLIKKKKASNLPLLDDITKFESHIFELYSPCFHNVISFGL